MKGRSAHLLLGIALAASVFAAPAHAHEGRLDKSFGDHGRVVVGRSFMAVGPKGSISLMSGKRVVLLRQNGERDPHFGRDGSVRVPARVAGWSFQVTQQAVDSRGRVLLFGTAFPPGHPGIEDESGLESEPISRAAVLRLLPDGRLDPGFGQNGSVLSNFGLRSGGSDLIGQTTGIAAGAVDSLDRPLFVVSTAAPYSPCGGHGFIGRAPSIIGRLTPSGLLDPEFGEGDGLSPTLPDIERTFVTLAATAANQPLMGGALGTGCFRGASVIRLNAEGAPLPGYGTEGRRNVPRFEFAAFTPKGGAILERRRYATEILRRLTPQGQPDPSFGHDGTVTLEIPPRTNLYPSAAVDSQGRTLIVGSFSLPVGGPRAKRAFIVVERLLSSGKVDRGFGRRGRLTVPVPGAQEIRDVQVSLDPEGRLLVLGEVKNPDPTGRAVLTRFRLD